MRYVFKMVKRVQTTGDQQVNGASEPSDDYVGVGDNHVMTCDIGDVAHLSVANVVLDKTRARPQNGKRNPCFKTEQTLTMYSGVSGFRTDADISGNLTVRERNLQRWEPSSEASDNMSLEEGGKTGWDQFATNQQRFGVETTYHESLYTTTIDRSDPLYQERAARAERIAREIENSSALNSHVSEERGNANADDSGVDEEEK
jgi:PAB1-binding protein PBP1